MTPQTVQTMRRRLIGQQRDAPSLLKVKVAGL
jgi:hypothetical protein